MKTKVFKFQLKSADERISYQKAFGWKMIKAVQKGHTVYAEMKLDDGYANNKKLNSLYSSFKMLNRTFPVISTIVASIGLVLLIVGLVIDRTIGMWLIIAGVIVLFVALFRILAYLLMLKEKKQTLLEVVNEASQITSPKE